MSDGVYERYKDALRRGHVAALRGRLDAALVAYGEAADIAPERALPHASIASVLARLGRQEDALGAYAIALERVPRDEGALAGRAELLAGMGRRVEAAEAFDVLAEVQEAAGRLPDAADTARRALELAESKARRRYLERLARRLRESPADEAAAAALERALGIVGPSAAQPAKRSDGEGSLSTTPVGDERAADDGREPVPVIGPAPHPEPGEGNRLAIEAEDRLERGDIPGTRDALLAAAAAHRAAGELDAAVDACLLALAVAPDDAQLHVLLTEIYLDRGWRGPATEKLLLLGRLTALTEDSSARRRIAQLVDERLADEPRLADLRRVEVAT